MSRRHWVALGIVAVMVLAIPAGVGATGYRWRDHRAPFDFTFDNHIDTHQQSLIADDAILAGFLYITPSGRTTEDGTPIAMHGNCMEEPRELHGGLEPRRCAQDGNVLRPCVERTPRLGDRPGRHAAPAGLHTLSLAGRIRSPRRARGR